MSGSPVRIDAEHAEQQVAVGDQQRGADGEDETDDGQAVGGDAGPVQALADGLEPSLDRRAPASVEHAQWVLGRERCRWCVESQGNTRRRGSRTPGAELRARPRARAGTDLRRLAADPVRALGGAGGGQDVPDGEDPQRGPGRPRRVGQDLARRGAALRRRGDPPARDGSRTATPSPTSTPRRRERRISVSLALAPFEHDGHKVNVIDTPGYADFVERRRRRAARRRPRRLRGVRGRGRRGADRAGVAHGRRARTARARSS